MSDPKNDLKEVQKQIIIANVLGAPGAILIGVALYSIFGAKGEPLHPALANTETVYSMLFIGVVIQIWELTKVIPLLKRKAKLQKEQK